MFRGNPYSQIFLWFLCELLYCRNLSSLLKPCTCVVAQYLGDYRVHIYTVVNPSILIVHFFIFFSLFSFSLEGRYPHYTGLIVYYFFVGWGWGGGGVAVTGRPTSSLNLPCPFPPNTVNWVIYCLLVITYLISTTNFVGICAYQTEMCLILAKKKHLF